MNLIGNAFRDCDSSVGDLNHWLFACQHIRTAIKFLIGKLVNHGIPLPQHSTSLLSMVVRNSCLKTKFINELREALLDTRYQWAAILQDSIRNLIKGMPRRIDAVIQARGSNIRY